MGYSALLVNDEQLSTAYGISGAVINVGYAVVNLIASQVIDNYKYFAQEVLFLCFLAIGILLLVLFIFRLAGTENVRIKQMMNKMKVMQQWRFGNQSSKMYVKMTKIVVIHR